MAFYLVLLKNPDFSALIGGKQCFTQSCAEAIFAIFIRIEVAGREGAAIIGCVCHIDHFSRFFLRG